jgi:ABC-type transport system involved in Fe-S cluster assembly fused permease/ATPase subunit
MLKFGGGHALVTLLTVSAYTYFTFEYSNSRIPIRKAMNDAEAEVIVVFVLYDDDI